MAYVQFRQIGAPDQHRANLAIRKKLRTCVQRTGGLVRRQALPPPGRLLSVLIEIRDELNAAYDILPLHRLILLRNLAINLATSVEHDLFHDCKPNGDTTKSLLELYRRIQTLLQDLGAPTNKQESDEETTKQIRQFLEAASVRGWRVAECLENTTTQQNDGFLLSHKCIHTIMHKRQDLLPREQDFGMVTAPIVLLNDTPIPEKILLDWTQRHDVYIVYGMYVVLTNCYFVGAIPQLVLDQKHNVKIERFNVLTEHIETDGTAIPTHLIPYPRRIAAHYYCPMVSVAAQQLKYFRQWDMLTR